LPITNGFNESIVSAMAREDPEALMQNRTVILQVVLAIMPRWTDVNNKKIK